MRSMNTAAATDTAGQTLRRYFRIGPRTRRFRDGRDLHAAMIEAIRNASIYPGFYTEGTETPLRRAFGVANAYEKHVAGYRLPGEQIAAIAAMSPYHFAALIDRMVADNVTNSGEAERWFAAHRNEMIAR
jgi:hypothetical protein